MSRPKRVGILGGGGFLASHLIDVLARMHPDASIVAVDVASPTAAHTGDPRATYHWNVDLADADAVCERVRGVDVLINTVGFVSFSRRDAAKLFRINADMAVQAARVCRTVDIPWLIHVSSVAALGFASAHDAAVTEDFAFDWAAAHRKRKYYMLSKAEGDRCLALCGDVLHRTVVFPAMMLGPRDRQSTPKLVQGMRAPLAIVPPGAINVVDVRDVAEGIIAIVQRGLVDERFILGGETLAYRDLFARIRGVLGARGPALALPRWTRPLLSLGARVAETLSPAPIALTHDNIDSIFEWRSHSSEKARRAFGYEPRWPLELMIRDYLAEAHARQR